MMGLGSPLMEPPTGDDAGDDATNPLLDAALRLYHSATTPQQERDAYLLARAFGLPASYGENDDFETLALNSIPLVAMTVGRLRGVTIAGLRVAVDQDDCLVSTIGGGHKDDGWRYICNALNRAERRGIEIGRKERWWRRIWRSWGHE